jgi:hypothetical protein
MKIAPSLPMRSMLGVIGLCLLLLLLLPLLRLLLLRRRLLLLPLLCGCRQTRRHTEGDECKQSEP